MFFIVGEQNAGKERGQENLAEKKQAVANAITKMLAAV
jgi:hypothetical protein